MTNGSLAGVPASDDGCHTSISCNIDHSKLEARYSCVMVSAVLLFIYLIKRSLTYNICIVSAFGVQNSAFIKKGNIKETQQTFSRMICGSNCSLVIL